MEIYFNLCAWAVLIAGGCAVVGLAWYYALLFLGHLWSKTIKLTEVHIALKFYRQYYGQLEHGKLICAHCKDI